MGCSIKMLDAISNGVMFFLKFYSFYWIVHTLVIISVSSLKECIVLYSLRKLSVELTFKLKWKLSRLLLPQIAVLFIGFKFDVDLLQKVCLSLMFLPLIDAGQWSDILWRNRNLIKYYYNFLDLQLCYTYGNINFESLLMVLGLLASLHFESLAY